MPLLSYISDQNWRTKKLHIDDLETRNDFVKLIFSVSKTSQKKGRFKWKLENILKNSVDSHIAIEHLVSDINFAINNSLGPEKLVKKVIEK